MDCIPEDYFVDKFTRILKQRDNKKVPIFGIRHVQVILLFLLLTIGIGMRVQLYIAIVAMTDSATSINPDVPTYNWSNKNVILSSFYWTYFLLQIIAGVIGRHYGTKHFLLAAMCFNTAACLLVPITVVKYESYGIMGCRILQGLSQGFFYPSIYNLLGEWTPPLEKSRLSVIAHSGASLGTIIAMPVSGYLCASWYGWPSTFYLYGFFGIIWMVLWALFGANSPAEHKSISFAEMKYIQTSQKLDEKNEEATTPWKAIFTSVPFWAITVLFTGSTWMTFTLGTEMPIYMSKVLKYDIESNGTLSALPYICQFLMGFCFAALADFIIKRQLMSVGATRKVFTTIACVLSSSALLALSFIPNGANTLSVIILVIIGGVEAISFGGILVNHIDLSPKYAGTIMAISNTFSSIFSFIVPLIIQVILTNETDRSQWRTIFIISCVTLVSTNIFYVVFASGKVQWWNSYGEKVKKEDTDLDKN